MEVAPDSREIPVFPLEGFVLNIIFQIYFRGEMFALPEIVSMQVELGLP